MSISRLKEIELEDEKSQFKKEKIEVIGRSLGLFEPESKLRVICYNIVGFKHYDNIILGLIGISTVLLTLDNPLYDKAGTEVRILYYLDFVMTVLFTIECAITIDSQIET